MKKTKLSKILDQAQDAYESAMAELGLSDKMVISKTFRIGKYHIFIYYLVKK